MSDLRDLVIGCTVGLGVAIVAGGAIAGGRAANAVYDTLGVERDVELLHPGSVRIHARDHLKKAAKKAVGRFGKRKYRVARGDTLSKIARSENVDTVRLAELNGIDPDTGVIFPNQVLCLP